MDTTTAVPTRNGEPSPTATQPPPDEPLPPGRRERKKLATRSALEEAALRLFASRGFEATTIEDITEAADVSLRTFFRYFASKEDVLLAEHAEDLVRMREMLAVASDDLAPMALIAEVLRGLAGAAEDRHDALLARIRVIDSAPSLHARQLENYAGFERAIAEAVARRKGTNPTRDLDAVLCGVVGMAAIRSAITVWVAGDGKEDLTALLESALSRVQLV